MTSLATRAPSFHSLRTNVPIGYKQVFVASDYAGTVTVVTRVNVDYWAITTLEAKDAFVVPRRPGVSAHVFLDSDGRFVADYHARDAGPVEIDRCHDVRAALGSAITSTTERGHQDGRW